MNIVISINVYKLVPFLLTQIENITCYVKTSHIIILNCNNYMFNELKKIKLPKNIFINPEIINKKRYHGSLTHGIISNMRFANKLCNFKFFIILSSRTFFYKNLEINNLNVKTFSETDNLIGEPPPNNWQWPTFKKTLLYKYYLNKKYKLYGSEHEGLCLSYNVTQNILQFLNNNSNIEFDLIHFPHCVEEFALQTIASNEINNNNLEFGFTLLGHGMYNDYDPTIPNKYTYKINF